MQLTGEHTSRSQSDTRTPTGERETGQDCSGYSSMALKLPKPGPNAVALKNDDWTAPITMSALNQGDLVIKANSDSSMVRHVVIFDHWADAGHTKYNVSTARSLHRRFLPEPPQPTALFGRALMSCSSAAVSSFRA
ncbi:hypothetical protein [Streptomyces orinoci]|uniref:Uncharacterized protein n=1 Tax=Streptomyces orinoci TaxID=67339 RepID=A0ABV3K1H7_STRON|nr:hypothetical protein [Streptomyces orinoci]